MSLHESVKLIRRASAAYLIRPLFVERREGCDLWVWPLNQMGAVVGNRTGTAETSHLAAVYPDGSAQLLSRDEDECMLFSTLWELER